MSNHSPLDGLQLDLNAVTGFKNHIRPMFIVCAEYRRELTRGEIAAIERMFGARLRGIVDKRLIYIEVEV